MSASNAITPKSAALRACSMILSGIAIGISLSAAGVPVLLAVGLALSIAVPGAAAYKNDIFGQHQLDSSFKQNVSDAPYGVLLSHHENQEPELGFRGIQREFATSMSPNNAVAQTFEFRSNQTSYRPRIELRE